MKKIIMSVLCVALLFCSFPVQASSVPHNCSEHKKNVRSVLQYAHFNGVETHTSTYREEFDCSICDKHGTEIVQVEEGHSIGSYTDLGHVSIGVHRYNVYCTVCQEYYDLGIACMALIDGGGHAHP